jgi:hypothetical protein
LIERPVRLCAALGLTVALAACATAPPPASTLPPPGPDETRLALAAWDAARARASSLPASRLLYDAKMASGAAPGVPGPLAVTYDGTAVVAASLTGPFGSHVAEYRNGELTGQDRKAFVVEPAALTSILAGDWRSASAPSVEGFGGGRALLALRGGEERVRVLLDVAGTRVASLDVEGASGRLSVTYEGEISPWPARLHLADLSAKRSLSLKLVAVEPSGGGSGS